MSYPWVQASAQVQAYGPVAPAIEREIRGLAHEIPDEQIEKDKPGNRGLFLRELQGIINRCDNGDPDDPRWDELRLRALDRLAKLTRIYEPDTPATNAGPGDARILAAAAARQLLELEQSLSQQRNS
jgi:hypothetical protein